MTNKAPSNLSNKEENIFQNSTYYLENQIIGSKNSLNLNIPKETKKEEKKKIMKQYKIYDSEEDESESEEEENEETEKIIDMKNKNEDKGQDKSFSWIKKLNDISRNEAGKSEMNAYNKKKQEVPQQGHKQKDQMMIIIIIPISIVIKIFPKISMKINYTC